MKSIADLFEVPLEEFTGARNALAKELRAAGKEDEAKQVAGLRKPPKALWLVNQLGRRAPIPLQALIAATRKIRQAQEQGLSGDEVREGMRAQRAALAALTAAANDPASERRVHDTLQAAALSDPDALRDGRLLAEMAPAGFGALLGAELQPLQASPKPHPPKVAEAKVVTAKDLARARAEAAEAAAEAKKEAARVAALEKAADKAEHAAVEAEAAAAKAEDAAATAAELAGSAKSKAVKAREEAKAARAAATSRRS